MASKIKIDIEEYLNSNGFLYGLKQKSLTALDFSCVLEKDITQKQKQELKRNFGGDINTVLRMILAIKGFIKEFKLPPIRKDLKVTHDLKKGTYGAKLITPNEEFSYCIGRPWHPKDPNSSINVYSYGSSVFHGTMKNAEDMRKFIDGQDKKYKHCIYKLVRINK